MILLGAPGSASAEPLPSRAQELAWAPREAWADVWRNLERLERLAPGSPEFRALAGELERFADQREEPARKQRDRVERFRVRVLRAQLARRAGTHWAPIQEPVVEIPWMPGESWLAAQVLLSGRIRDQALLHALTDAGAPPFDEWLPAAAQALREASLAARVADAEQIASAIDARRPSAASAGDLARVLALAGERARARTLLLERLAVAPDAFEDRELLAALGELELAEPASASASQHLGSAFARGSLEAGLLLARRALDAGELGRARSLYRALIVLASGEGAIAPREHSAASGARRALRGWGLACLPSAAYATVTDHAGAP